jgi:Flp pilus assembly protein TadD
MPLSPAPSPDATRRCTVNPLLRPLLALALCLGPVSLLTAQKPPSPEEIARAVQQLGDQRFAVREKASALLRAAGRAGEAALREALKSPDSEVVRRAQQVLDEFKWGIYPDTPPEIADKIRSYQSGDAPAKAKAVKELVALGARAVAPLAKLSTAEEDVNQRQALLQTIEAEVILAVPAKMVAGDFAAAEAILELGLLTGTPAAAQNYGAFLLLRGRLDEQIARFEARKDLPPGVAPAEVLTCLYRLRGDLDKARTAAKQTGRADLMETALYKQADWAALAALPVLEGEETVRAQGLTAAYYRLAGKRDLFERNLAELRKHTGDESGTAADALFANDRPNDAIALLAAGPDYSRPYELLVFEGRYREAFELYDKAKKTVGDEGLRLKELDIFHARTLYRLGEKDKAVALFTRLGGQPANGTEGLLAETEYKLGLKELALKHLAPQLNNARDEALQLALTPIFAKQSGTAMAWWKYLRGKNPKEAPAATLQRLASLLEGKLPATEVTALLTEAEQSAPKLSGSALAERWRILAETSLLIGREDQARTYLGKWADAAGRAEALLRLGHAFAAKSQWAQAADAYRRASEKEPHEAVPLYLRGWAMTKAGQEAEGRKLIDLAHQLPVGNEETRYALAEALRERGLTVEARRELEFIVRIGGFQSVSIPNALGRLTDDALARKDYLQAAANLERVVLQCLRIRWGFVKSEGYLLAPLLVHYNRARGLLATGRPIQEVRPEIETCLASFLGDLNLPIYLVADLEKRGFKKDADELFTRTFAAQEKAAAEYPRCASHLNALAWTAARCRRELDKGLAFAQKAMELAPDDSAFADTLAEVYFQRGDKERALGLIKKCIEMDPKREYYRRQLRRFEAGDPLAEVIE